MSIKLEDIGSGFNLNKLNLNFQKIEDEFNNNTLNRDGLEDGEDNSMQNDLDMNSFYILNSPKPIDPTHVVRLKDLEEALGAGDGEDRPYFIKGSRGNPYMFDTIADAKAGSEEFAVGDWVETRGAFTKFDRKNAQYYIVEDNVAGLGDGFYILDFGNNRKGIMMYLAPSNNDPANESSVPYNPPYEFNYPRNSFEQSDMRELASYNSLGDSGSTWHVRPVAVGRKENGIDVVYKGGTYGTEENNELEQGSLSSDLFTNKRRGEAVITVSRITVEDPNGDGSVLEVEFDKRGINDPLISYREDEHHQPAVQFNNTNGQLITAWGSRNSARNQQDEDASPFTFVRYGKDLSTLSKSEKVEFPSTTDYAQMWFIGNTSFLFQRENVGNWYSTGGSGGQNYNNSVQFLDSEGDQYYIETFYTDYTYTGENEGVAFNRPALHMFMNSHPTVVADRELKYTKGTFYVAGTSSGAFDAGGVWFSDAKNFTSINGERLGSFTAPLVKGDIETVYTSPVGKSHRLLDIQYGYVPRALIAEFDFDWEHGASIPYGKTYDLKVVYYNFMADTWSSTTIASGVRGALGYKPVQAAFDETGAALSPITRGVEGYTSFYHFGASFYRGKNYLQAAPIVYYCDREGDDKTKHRLRRVTLADDYSSVSSTDDIVSDNSKIMFRPEMTLYGDKRFLFYNEADGWSTFNSFVVDDRWVDESAIVNEAVAPTISMQPQDVTVSDGTNLVVGLDAFSPDGKPLTYEWEFSDNGGSTWSTASSTDPYFQVFIELADDGRMYRCNISNAAGSVTSNEITITVA